MAVQHLAKDIPGTVALGFNRFAGQAAPDVLAEGRDRLIPAIGLLIQGTEYDGLQVIVDVSPD
jgi:hypothetical protein